VPGPARSWRRRRGARSPCPDGASPGIGALPAVAEDAVAGQPDDPVSHGRSRTPVCDYVAAEGMLPLSLRYPSHRTAIILTANPARRQAGTRRDLTGWVSRAIASPRGQ
jgi:hypothetical protein